MNTKSKKHGTLALFVVCFAIFAPNYAQYQLSPLVSSIMSDFALTPSQFSSLFTAPMLPAIFLSLLAGILVDRFNPKYVVGSAILISTIGSFLNLVSTSYSIMFIAFAMIGLSAGFLNSCGPKLLSGWFTPDKISSKMGIMLSSATLAMTIAMATTALFPNRLVAFITTAGLFLITLVLWFLLYKAPEADENTQVPSDKMSFCLKVVVKNKYVWIIGFCLFFVMGAIIIMSSFIPTILEKRGFSSVQAGYYSSIYTIGNLLSCFIAPPLALKLKSAKKAVLLLAGIAFLGVSFSWMAPAGIPLSVALLITGICVGGNMPLLMSMPIQIKGIGPQFAGTAGGFVATIQIIGAIALPSYILLPIAGERLHLAFFLGGICMLTCGVFCLILPSSKSQTNTS